MGSQAELVSELERRGHPAAQATVSRDVRHLGLLKLPLEDGSSRYVAPEAGVAAAPADRSGLQEACRLFVTEIGDVQSLLFVKTRAGRANAVAVAIDESHLPGVAGTLAGDDTILVLVRSAKDRRALRDRLRSFAD